MQALSSLEQAQSGTGSGRGGLGMGTENKQLVWRGYQDDQLVCGPWSALALALALACY